MINIFTILLIIVFIIFIRNKTKENFISVSPNDKMFELSKQNKINFNYKIIPPNPTIAELNQTILPIEKQFLKEQEYGATRNILYPNTYVECIDTTGKPQWSSRYNKVGIADNLILPKVLNSYGFNKEKISNPGGIIDPDEFIENANVKFNKTDLTNQTTRGKFERTNYDNKNNIGKKIQEVYNNSFVNFKNLIPNKTMINDKTNTQSMQAASDLQYLTPDTWVYENEKGENGGIMYNNKTTTVFASDPSTLGIEAIF